MPSQNVVPVLPSPILKVVLGLPTQEITLVPGAKETLHMDDRKQSGIVTRISLLKQNEHGIVIAVEGEIVESNRTYTRTITHVGPYTLYDNPKWTE